MCSNNVGCHSISDRCRFAESSRQPPLSILTSVSEFDEKPVVNGQYHFVCLLLELVSFFYVLVEVPQQLAAVWRRLSPDIQSKFENTLTLRWLLSQPSDTNILSAYSVSRGDTNENGGNGLVSNSGGAGHFLKAPAGTSYARLSGPVKACQPLVHALIKSYLDDGMPVDNLCSRLHGQCPQLFTTEDYIAANALGAGGLEFF